MYFPDGKERVQKVVQLSVQPFRSARRARSVHCDEAFPTKLKLGTASTDDEKD
jgi:hypothetical protein